MATKNSGGSKGPTDYRNSKTGEFTTRDWAKAHPAKSEAEHNRKPAPSPKTKPGK